METESKSRWSYMYFWTHFTTTELLESDMHAWLQPGLARHVSHLQNGGREVLSDELLNRLQRPAHPQFQSVTIAIATLQLLWCTEATERAIDHDANPGAERLTLSHTVGGEQHRLPGRHHAPDDGPQELPGSWIHA